MRRTVSRVERQAELRLTDAGSLEGKLTVTFTGLEALWRRIEERNEDDAYRKKFLEDEVKEYAPVGVDVELTNQPDWKSSSDRLIAEFDLKIPGWVSNAGHRDLVPVGLFGRTERRVFERETRVHPIYFSFPAQKVDQVTIQLPLGWQVSSLPTDQGRDAKACVYSLKAENKNGVVRVVCSLDLKFLLTETKYYPALRSFFQAVRTGDDQQIVLQPSNASASK